MGVQGLSSLLERHGRIYRDARLRCSKLVVDGCNLIYLLYFKAGSGLDQNHGGDYVALEDLIERFIAALRACRVDPYVLMDGSYDASDKKLATCIQRAQELVKLADCAATTGDSLGILPPLAKKVFKQTLARLEVPMAQCYGEADHEIAALAAEWQCPVLSNDSDFYIFHLPGGLLPITHFRWEDVQPGDATSFVPCKSYNVSSFCIYFQVQRPLLPAFATLAGNDYVKLQGLKWAQYAPPSSATPSHLEGLLSWLRAFQQPAAALEEALELLGELSVASRKALMAKLLVGMEDYQLHASALSRFFTHGVAPPLPHPDKEAPPLPDWLRLPLTRVQLTADVLMVLLRQRMNLSITVETGELPSANLPSLRLRRLMYGLLLGRGCPAQVTERDRRGLQVVFVPVKPALSSTARGLRLHSLPKVELSVRLQVLLEALGVSEAALRPLPPQLRLPLAVTCYWMQNAQPPPDKRLLKALLQGMNMGTTTAGLQTNGRRKRKPNVDAAHAFNQWQICLKDGIHLNQLLNFPLPEPDVARLFQGTLVHRLLTAASHGRNLKRLLKSNHAHLRHYIHMLRATLRSHAQVVPGLKAQARRQRRESLMDLDVNLQQLWLLEDEVEVEARSATQPREEELQVVERLVLKTRFRTKHRGRSNNPELARKEECRGQDLL